MSQSRHEPIPQDVASLLRDHIATYEQLGIVLLLRAHAGKRWTVRAAAERLNLSDEIAAVALDELWASRVLEVSPQDSKPTYRYGPANAELAARIDALARLFQDQRAEILRLLCANAVERVRTRAIRTFGDSIAMNKPRPDE
jgi:hypothetical protein